MLASIRAITSIPAHAAFGCLMGYFMLKYHFRGARSNIILAFIIPSLVHFVYNFTALTGVLFFLLTVVLVLIFISIFILGKLKKEQ